MGQCTKPWQRRQSSSKYILLGTIVLYLVSNPVWCVSCVACVCVLFSTPPPLFITWELHPAFALFNTLLEINSRLIYLKPVTYPYWVFHVYLQLMSHFFSRVSIKRRWLLANTQSFLGNDWIHSWKPLYNEVHMNTSSYKVVLITVIAAKQSGHLHSNAYKASFWINGSKRQQSNLVKVH